jgi:hypothetical protein
MADDSKDPDDSAIKAEVMLEEAADELSGKTTLVFTQEEAELPPNYPSGPEAEGWIPLQIEAPLEPIKKVFSLGDLHGWAPGLITYLTHHQLAKIEINGLKTYHEREGKLSVNIANMASIFPDPIEYLQGNKNGQFEGAGLHGQPYGSKKWNYGAGSIKAEWIGCERDPSACFVQVGDVFDRSDYSELAAEILRQLIVQAPLRVFVLAGNHEQFLFENDFTNWKFNEEKWAFTTEHLKSKKGFHTRFHESTHGWKASNNHFHKDVFELYQSSAAVLYLTQACALAKLGLYKLPDGINQEEILRGGFSAYECAMNYLQKSFVESKTIFPGAFTSIGIGHTLFVHAEVEAFKQTSIEEVLNFQHIKKHSTELVFSEYRLAGGDITASPDFNLLWKRNSSRGANASPPAPACASYIQNIVRDLPGIRHYVHGHSPVNSASWFDHLSGSSVISYLARSPNNSLSRAEGSVRIHMIDEGICPAYFIGKEDIFDSTRIPIGLALHPESVKYHGHKGGGMIESEESEWLYTLDKKTETLPFFVPEKLVLFEPSGIGAFSYSNMMMPPLSHWGNSLALPPNSLFSSWRLLVDSTKQIHSDFTLLLYPANDGLLSGPARIPMNMNGRIENRPLDEILKHIWDGIYDSFDVKGSRTQDSLTPKGANKWIDQVVPESRNRFGPLQYSIRSFGQQSLIKSLNACYVKFVFSDSGAIRVFVVNGSSIDLQIALHPLTQIPHSNVETVEIAAKSFHLEHFSFKSAKVGDAPIEISLSSGKTPQRIFETFEHFMALEKQGEAAGALTNTDSLNFVVWPKPTRKLKKLKKVFSGSLPEWKETTASLTASKENQSVPPPPPERKKSAVPPPPAKTRQSPNVEMNPNGLPMKKSNLTSKRNPPLRETKSTKQNHKPEKSMPLPWKAPEPSKFVPSNEPIRSIPNLGSKGSVTNSNGAKRFVDKAIETGKAIIASVIEDSQPSNDSPHNQDSKNNISSAKKTRPTQERTASAVILPTPEDVIPWQKGVHKIDFVKLKFTLEKHDEVFLKALIELLDSDSKERVHVQWIDTLQIKGKMAPIEIKVGDTDQALTVHIGLEEIFVIGESNISLYVPGVEDKPKYNKENSVIYFGDKFVFKLRYIEFGVKEV